MSNEPLFYGRQAIDEDDIREVAECLRSDWLTQGPRVRAFEDAICGATGARYAVAVCNGTAALHLAVLALGVRAGDVGVVPAVTFLSSAHCLRYVGANVAFADVEPDTGLVCPESVDAVAGRLERNGQTPRVIIPVDLTGQPADWRRVREIADQYGARVVLDAAHSLGARSVVGGEALRIGESGYADVATLSFHPVKHVTSAEGGAIVTNDPALHAELASLRSFGVHKDAQRFHRSPEDPFVGPWYYETDVLGFNYRLSDVHCALGLSQLRKLPEFLAKRRRIAERYDEALSSEPLLKYLRPLKQHQGRENAYHLYVVQVAASNGDDTRTLAARRKDLFCHLQARNIHCQVHYVPLPWQPYYEGLLGSPGASYPGSEAFYSASLSLPLFPAMSDQQVDRVVAALRDWALSR